MLVSNQTSRVIVVLIGVGLVCGFAFFVLSDLDRRVSFVADDAFYVTIPAANLARYGLPSLDGVNPTNGFHPAIFILDYALSSMGVEEVYLVNQIAGVLFLFISAGLLYKYSRRFLDMNKALLAVLAYLLFPHMLATSVNGLESTLFACAIILFYSKLASMIGPVINESRISYKGFLWLGLLGGLCYLCRTEFAIHCIGLAVGGGLCLLLRGRQAPALSKRKLAIAGCLLIVPVAAAFAWFTWFGYVHTGHLMQSSASQKSVFHELFSRGTRAFGTAFFARHFLRNGLLPVVCATAPLFFLPKRKIASNPILTMLVSTLVTVYLFYFFFISVFQDHYIVTYLTLTFLILPPAVKHLEFHGDSPLLRKTLMFTGVILVVAITMLEWTTSTVFFCMNITLVVGYWISLFIWRKDRDVLRRHLTSLLIGCMVAYVVTPVVWKKCHREHLSRLHLSQRLNEVLPNDVIVGAGPAGIYAKFLERTIMNLDGAISWPALEAIQNKRYDEFLNEQSIDVILEGRRSDHFTDIGRSVQVRKSRTDLITLLRS